ncbi:MAG: MATE family efflux transporter [Clostridiales bacterium]|nr:MATE family efflux transporter [Clostridiales bacterium]
MEKTPEKKNDFSVGSIPGTIMRLAIPMIGAQLVNALYNVVDRIYIGKIPGEGALPLTGVGLTFPIISIVMAFANLCGMGGAPLMSIARGEGNLDRAEKILGNAAALLILFGIVIVCAGLYFMEPLLWLFGASESTIGYARDYLSIYLIGTPCVMMVLGMNPYITSQGFARTGMLTVMIGAVINIVLDPLFIFVFNMGVKGAALATIISQMLCVPWVLKFLCGKKAIVKLRPRNMRIQWDITGKILSLGVSNFTMGLTESAVTITCNSTLQQYGSMAFAGGGDVYVGVMTVISTLRQLTMLTLNGLANGASPVISYNYGAKCYDRTKKSILFLSICCLVYATTAWAILMAIPGVLIRVFNDDPLLVEYGIPAVRMYFCAFCVLFMQMAGQTSFVALGKSRQAIFFSLLRKTFIVVPLVLIIPRITNLGAFGVFVAEPISDVVGSIACFTTFMLTVYRRMGKAESPKK